MKSSVFKCIAGAWARLTAGWAAAAAPLAASDFAALPAIEDPELSPGGTALAAKIAVEGEQYLTIVNLADGKKTVAPVGEFQLNWWRWINDRWLVVGTGRIEPSEGLNFYVTRSTAITADGTKIKSAVNGAGGETGDDLLWAAHDGSARLLIADDAIHPGVHHLHFDMVLTRLQGRSHIHAIRRMPHNTKVLAIHRHHGKVLHIAQVEVELRALPKPISLRVNRLGVRARAGEILHSRIRTLRPVNQLVECHRSRRAAIRQSALLRHGPGDFPRPVYTRRPPARPQPGQRRPRRRAECHRGGRLQLHPAADSSDPAGRPGRVEKVGQVRPAGRPLQLCGRASRDSRGFPCRGEVADGHPEPARPPGTEAYKHAPLGGVGAVRRPCNHRDRVNLFLSEPLSPPPPACPAATVVPPKSVDRRVLPPACR